MEHKNSRIFNLFCQLVFNIKKELIFQLLQNLHQLKIHTKKYHVKREGM